MKQLYYVFFLFYTFSFSQTASLIFDYDESGNQILREYSSGIKSSKSSAYSLIPNSEALKEVTIYPNPVDAELTISWNSQISDLITKIELVSYNGNSIENVSFSNLVSKTIFDMSYKLPGVYYLKIYCSDGRVINHSVIKN